MREASTPAVLPQPWPGAYDSHLVRLRTLRFGLDSVPQRSWLFASSIDALRASRVARRWAVRIDTLINDGAPGYRRVAVEQDGQALILRAEGSEG